MLILIVTMRANDGIIQWLGFHTQNKIFDRKSAMYML